MHRTQISLTDGQYERLLDESSRSGRSLSELIRRAIDECFEAAANERLRLLDSAFGAWGRREESGSEFVERVRTGTARRLRRDE